MIKETVLSQCETMIYDCSNDEYVKWIGEIKDRRDIKDLGDTAIDIFDLDKRHIKPVYLSARVFKEGTTTTTKFRLLLNNRDLLQFTSTEIISLNERDDLEQIKPLYKFLINGNVINFRDFGLRDRFLSGNITLDFIRDFYFNYWIPSENNKN
jgi:hypothetical protein